MMIEHELRLMKGCCDEPQLVYLRFKDNLERHFSLITLNICSLAVTHLCRSIKRSKGKIIGVQ